MAQASHLSSSPSWEVLAGRMPRDGTSFACNLSLENENKNKIVVVSHAFFQPCIFDVDTQTWTQLPPTETHSVNGVTCLGNTIFLTRIGYNDETLIESITLDEEGNPDHQQGWQSLPSTSPARVHCATVAFQRNIFIIGGKDDQSCLQRVERFSVIYRSWIPLPNMTEPRAGCAATTTGDKLYVFGGVNNQAIAKNTAEFLDLHAGTWHSLPTMPCFRTRAAAVVVGQFIFLIGGMDENENKLGRVDCLNTVTHQWMLDALPLLNTPRYFCGAAATAKGEVFIFGGLGAFERGLGSMESIKIMPYYILVPKLQNLFQQENLPLGLWSFIIAKCPSNVVFHILLSERSQLDSVLLHRPEEKKIGKKRKISE